MKYVVYGLGISGISTLKHLAEQNLAVIATDDNSNSISKAKETLFQENLDKKIEFLQPEEIEYDYNTNIVFSPGIPLYYPKKHQILEKVEEFKTNLGCDIEFFYRHNSKGNFIGITGTNGKSTTTALTGFVLKDLGIDSRIGGNIGTPCFDLLEKDETAIDKSFVFEISSFQLDLMSQTHFHIASLLNITPDHIDRHGSMANYIESKKRIFLNQTKDDFALINVDDEIANQVFIDLKNNPSFKAKLIPISAQTVQENGISLIDGQLTDKIHNEEIQLTSQFLKGKHQDQNMAFSFAISKLLTQKNSQEIARSISKFHGLKHRMQILGEIDGIKFINDSKATNAESTKHALTAYNNIFLILGGKEKEGGIEILQPFFGNIKKAYLIGEATENFSHILQKNLVNFEKCGDLKNAFTKAFIDAKNCDLSDKSVILSPACSSFDQWKNFEQRGDYFCELFETAAKTKHC